MVFDSLMPDSFWGQLFLDDIDDEHFSIFIQHPDNFAWDDMKTDLILEYLDRFPK